MTAKSEKANIREIPESRQAIRLRQGGPRGRHQPLRQIPSEAGDPAGRPINETRRRIGTALFAMTLASFLVFSLYWVHQGQLRSETTLAALTSQMDGLWKEGEQLRAGLAEARTAADSGHREVERLQAQLSEAQQRLRSLEAEREAGAQIIKRYAGGVVLIEVDITFVDASGRSLRYAGLDETGRPLRDELDQLLLSAEGEGPVAVISSRGTGFLVSSDGKILTSRHVAEPWWQDEELKPLLDDGWIPKRLLLRAFFPHTQEPFPAEVLRVSDRTDVALLKVDSKGARIPVLKLDRTGQGADVGSPVLLIGYPTGLTAILAKVDPQTRQEIVTAGRNNQQAITEALSRRGLIRPSTTRGHIGDLLPHQIVFDAESAIGSSGGPLLNLQGRVIGINHAIVRDFGGSNLAIPIRYGIELLDETSPLR